MQWQYTGVSSIHFCLKHGGMHKEVLVYCNILQCIHLFMSGLYDPCFCLFYLSVNKKCYTVQKYCKKLCEQGAITLQTDDGQPMP